MTENTKKKICIISDSEQIFDVRKFYKEALSLARNGFHVHYITHGDKPENKTVENVNIYILPTKRWLPVNPFINFLKIIKALKIRPDYFHLHSPYLLPFGLIIKLITHKPIIYVVLEDYIAGIREDENIKWPTRLLGEVFIRMAEFLFLNFATALIVSDDAVEADYQQKHNNICKLYNYPILKYFNPGRINNELLNKYKDSECLIYVGGISVNRGILDITEATSLIANRIKNIKLLIVAPRVSNSLYSKIMAICQRYHTEKNIEIIKSVDHKDVPYYINCCKIGLATFRSAPKLQKNIPQKIFEYLACQKPVIGSDLSPIASFIENSHSGIVVEAGNVEATVGAIMNLLKNPQLAENMGHNGYKFCQEKWNWDQMEKKLLALYSNL